MPPRLPQVNPSLIGTPYSRLNAEGAFGSGEGLQKVGQVLGSIGQEIQQRQNQARAMDWYKQISDWQTENVYDPNKGALSAKKEDAIGITDRTTKAFDEFGKQLESQAVNDEQKAALGKMLAQESEGVFRTLAGHERGEFDQLEEEKYRGAVDAAVSNGINGFADPVMQFGARLRGEYAVKARAASAKWSPEREDFEMRKFQTAFHLGIADRLATVNATAAADYMAKNGHLVDGEARKGIDRVIEGARVRDQSRTEADRIWAETGGDENAASAMVAGIQDTPLHDAVDLRLKQRVGEERAMRQAADSPRAARLEATISRFLVLDRSADDYIKLSDEGKSLIEAKYRSAQNAREALNTNARQRQDDTDKFLLAWFRGSLPLQGESGKDQVSIDIENSRVLADGSPRLRELVKGEQKMARAQVAKGLSADRQDLSDRADGIALTHGLKKTDTGRLKAWMASEFSRLKEPTRKDLDDIEARAKEMVTIEWKIGPVSVGTKQVPPWKVQVGDTVVSQPPLSRVPAGPQLPDIPPDVKKQLERRFRDKGVEPTPARLWNAYQVMQKAGQ